LLLATKERAGRLRSQQDIEIIAVVDSLPKLAESLPALKNLPAPAQQIPCPQGVRNFAATP
jgi:hypothetical protein